MLRHSLRRLVWYAAYPILSRVKKLQNSHRNAECYIFGDGSSIAHFDLASFDDRVGIAVNAFPRHKDAAQAKIRYWVVAEPAFFLPPIIRTRMNRGRTLRNRIQMQRLYSPPIVGIESLTLFVSLWSFPFRFRKRTQYFLDRFPQTLQKSTCHFGKEDFAGSINAAVSLAVYLGFSRAYLVGFDYTHNPPVGGHWYDINSGDVRMELEGYNWSFFDRISGEIELVTVTLTEQKTYLKSITYSALTGRPTTKKKNNEMLMPEDLKTLSTHYRVYESQRFGKVHEYVTKRSEAFSLVRTLINERQVKRVDSFIRFDLGLNRHRSSTLATRCRSLSDAWQVGQVSHQEATVRIQDTLEHCDLRGECFSELSGLYGQLMLKGLFTAALEVLRRQCELVKLREKVDSRSYIRSVLVSIYEGDLQSAREKLSLISKSSLGALRATNLIYADVSSFLEVCENHESGKTTIRQSDIDTSFQMFAKNRECLLTGPGMSATDVMCKSGNIARAQIMKKGIGVVSEASEFCNVVYLSSETAQWITRGGHSALLENHNFAVFKDHAEYLIVQQGIRNGRCVPFSPGLSALFWSGTAGMGLISILDSMLAPYSGVSVSGFDLYASEHEYNPLIQEEMISMNRTSSGGTGDSFYRCHSLSEHNPFVNRWLLRALNGSDRFHPDSTLDRVLKMTDEEYASTLDRLHGASRK